jgi:hypothetical protein
MLNYAATANPIHLSVRTRRSRNSAAPRAAQEFNQRKDRQGAFWEDRYHATALDVDEHLYRCLVYIDLNMVRRIR